MSERDRINYMNIKADPEKYRAYLDRKRRERNRKQSERSYETLRKRQWRAKNPDVAQRIRRANHAVEWALNSGKIVRPEHCSDCGVTGKIEAHHHKGYAPESWLDVQWLCVFCHRKADRKPADAL